MRSARVTLTFDTLFSEGFFQKCRKFLKVMCSREFPRLHCNCFENCDSEAIFDEPIYINEVVDKFYDFLYTGFDRFIPKSNFKNNDNPPWLNRRFLTLKIRRNKLLTEVFWLKDLYDL